MPQMDLIVKLLLVVLIGLLVGTIVLYHVWLDRRIARERQRERASAPAPARQLDRVDPPLTDPGRTPRSA